MVQLHPYRTPDPPEKPQHPIYSGEDCRCRKCGLDRGGHSLGVAKTEYRSVDNLIVRECRRCGYRWCERPLDANQ